MKTRTVLFVLSVINIVLFAQTPEWQWASQAGGYDREYAYGIAIDNIGNSYVTGYFEGSATFGSSVLTSFGEKDIYVAKMDVDGNWLWAVQAGGIYSDFGFSIVIDNAGNNFITGSFQENATFGSYTLSTSGGYYVSDIFVAKIDTDGNWLWASQASGGAHTGSGNAIGMDSWGNCYVSGNFSGSATFGPYSINGTGVFVAEIDANGNWQSTIAQAEVSGNISGIAVDNAGNVYITGWFGQQEVTFGSYTITSWSGDDIFVAKMDAGGDWIWAVQAGENFGHDQGLGITIDNSGCCIVTGYFSDTANFGYFSVTSSGIDDIFVAKINPDGDWLWATSAGGTSFDQGNAITFDDAGYCYVTGGFVEIATFGNTTLTGSTGDNIFVAKIDGFGDWHWATQSVSTAGCLSNAITMNNSENIFVAGFFWDSITFGSQTLTSIGDYDVFVAQLGMPVYADDELISAEPQLSNYPNPFNPSTTIEFSTQNESNIELTIFNIRGQKVKTLINNDCINGNHSIMWDGVDESNNPVSSGIYYYKLNVNGITEAVKKCLLLK